MNTSPKSRIAAFVAACFVTFSVVSLLAGYAYPEAQPIQLASAAR